MRAQARDQGRYLGGRPPYGYRLVDAGPHPNAVHAAWGRRLQRLEPDHCTAPTVQWILPSAWPDAVSRASLERSTRVACRAHPMWTQNATVTGEVTAGDSGRWQRSWPTRAAPAGRFGTANASTTTPHQFGVRPRRGKAMRWNPADEWVISRNQARPSLVSQADYVRTQAVNAVAPPRWRPCPPGCVPTPRGPGPSACRSTADRPQWTEAVGVDHVQGDGHPVGTIWKSSRHQPC